MRISAFRLYHSLARSLFCFALGGLTGMVQGQGLAADASNSMSGFSRPSRSVLLNCYVPNQYLCYPVDALSVLSEYSHGGHPADAALNAQQRFDIVVSGTFFDHRTRKPLGSIVRGGRMDVMGVPKTARRGAVAVLQDGTVLLGESAGVSLADIQRRFSQPRNTVVNYVGGGALLVHGGRPVSSQHLAVVERFDQRGSGLGATQFRNTDHVVLGVARGQLYAIVAIAKSGAQIQRDLVAMGFDSAVKFDGGSGCYSSLPGYQCKATNPSGFGVRVRR